MTRYYTEDEHPNGEYDEPLQIANESGTVGVYDQSDPEYAVEWQGIHLTPGLLREWAELIEFAYGRRMPFYPEVHGGDIEIGFRYRESEHDPIELVARRSGDRDGKCVSLATRVPRGEL